MQQKHRTRGRGANKTTTTLRSVIGCEGRPGKERRKPIQAGSFFWGQLRILLLNSCSSEEGALNGVVVSR